MSDVLKVTDLRRTFVQGDVEIQVLRGVNLNVAEGEIVALLGPSGSGKSTLLQAVGLLEGGFEGSIRIKELEAAALKEAERTAARRDLLGFVYQFHHLLPDFSALENVVLAQLVHGATRADAVARAESLLGTLGLAERLTHKPSKLSGGEQQRVAVARALVAEPRLILADEPTGNLDTNHGDEVMRMLQQLNAEGSTIVMVTHSPAHADYASRVVNMLDGRILQQHRRAA
jgi:lipoprotein-releasing system ATP-binding protein